MAITDAEGLHGVGTELVTNGTFDSATTGWTLTNNATLSVVADGQVGNCLRITCDGSNNPGADSTAFTLTAGKTYQFSFWVKAGDEATFQAVVNDSVSTWGVKTNTEAQTTWRNYTFTFEATATAATAKVSLSQIATAGAATYIDFDSVSVIEVAQWLEKPTVIFTAGTLSSIDDCVTEVESMIKRGTLSTTTTPSTTQVKRWLIRAKQELAEIKNFTWTRRYSYVTTTVSVWRYGLPSDYHGGDVYLRDLIHALPFNLTICFSCFCQIHHPILLVK